MNTFHSKSTTAVLPDVSLATPLILQTGTLVYNRIVKAAMHESMGDKHGAPSRWLLPLYEAWAMGGVGLSITGNVMIDGRARSEPGNVVVEDERHLDFLREWACRGSIGGTRLWMQINHPGKQAMNGLNPENLAPSSIPFSPALAPYFPTPREIRPAEIKDVIGRFANTARIAKKAGFGGVQIHAAHGYLINQFLSPYHNRREDDWGGTPEKRRRFLLAVYQAIRTAVGRDYPIGIKLNSADFQKGGYDERESLEAVLAIADAGIDMIEISGGTYESPVMTGAQQAQKESTRLREAYFLDFAEQVRSKTSVPLMVTGGFRTAAGMNAALQSGALDFIGLARLLSIDPEVPQLLLAGFDPSHEVTPRVSGVKAIDRSRMMEIVWYTRQLMRIARQGRANPDESVLKVALCYLLSNFLRGDIGLPKFRSG
ncbi:NADH:flavin oxidoreductase/NADH oxidase family protein [Pseudomonas aeruginosa]|uniref:NADH:flavin oxidoreductase/NADH oxidase family protein n=1 Tax=Pseudomonas aeruginosa TaxID=287 RepID=UPI0032FAF2A7|nr:NADH:flavin oxidoreductase/NADH oxidase family protein [Pseudomonas aeruginosa]HCF5273124.1 NADH:flavin oxidoreductase/NADH oxidase family protein [Pseudomonas aeruginosa]HCF7348861.1 NADH:flavin oxidoreductase/NADH oxidase family protein [Pseudomonas aeruginosa]HCF7352345.1 NADH:flavin oxidoreductase/NADH oxidase family protein [Pseudomonas aeruginosa]HDQ4123533.1 NADH:flavin oxidoreductase/NADH oxidase family protein [Pseudomonas aeruginosa]